MTQATAPARRRLALPFGPGFWALAAVFLATMSFTTIPTPLYAAFERRDGFSTPVVTVVFTAYAVGVAAALYLVGHQGDRVGRIPVLAAAVLLEVLSAVVFLLFPQVPGLLVARLLSGLGVGAFTASATAQLGELRSAAAPDAGGRLPDAVATVANIGGLGLGPLVGGVLAVTTAPTSTPFLIYAIALVVLLGLALLVPETVRRAHPLPRYRPQHVVVPREARAAFWSAGVAVFAAFSVFGLFSAVTPSVLTTRFHEPSPLVIGAVSGVVLIAGALAQLGLLAVPVRTCLVVAVPAMVVGLAALAAGVLASSLPLFVIGGVVAGAGVGLVFRSCLGIVRGLVPPEARGETLAGVFLMAYLGLIVPVLAVGGALIALPVVPVLTAFVAVVAVLVLVAGLRLLRTTAS